MATRVVLPMKINELWPPHRHLKYDLLIGENFILKSVQHPMCISVYPEVLVALAKSIQTQILRKKY